MTKKKRHLIEIFQRGWDAIGTMACWRYRMCPVTTSSSKGKCVNCGQHSDFRETLTDEQFDSIFNSNSDEYLIAFAKIGGNAEEEKIRMYGN